MDWLADDLLLLAVRGNGTLAVRRRLRFGIAAAELVQLAARGSVDVGDGQITVLDSSPPGDPLLDDALASMTAGAAVPSVRVWVGLNRPGLVGRHMAALMAAGTIRERPRKAAGLFPVMRLEVTGPARLEQARARLDAVASGTAGTGPEQAALAGLVGAVGLDTVLYRGEPLARIRAAAADDQIAGAARSVGKRTTAVPDNAPGTGAPGLDRYSALAITAAAHYVARHPPAYGTHGGGTGSSQYHGGGSGGGHHHGGGLTIGSP